MAWPGDIVSLILSVVFGAAIGLEREIRGKAAGLRTDVLICLGAVVFTLCCVCKLHLELGLKFQEKG
ncbi:MAG: MgtC/SapB family protein [Sedimentisphaerales bacterium]|nr:MgtC/SapB family protein [Sedimentisphaerales bacterium]